MEENQETDFIRNLRFANQTAPQVNLPIQPQNEDSDFIRNLRFANSRPIGAAIEKPVSSDASRPALERKPRPQAPAVPEEEKTWSETLGRAGKQFFPSVKKMAGDIIHAVTNPIETGTAIGQLGSGLYSKAEGVIGKEQDPKEKAQKEALFDTLIDDYVKKYGSIQGFKNALAEDPASILSDASLFITGGASAIAKGTGIAGKTTGMAGTAAKALEKTGQAAQYLDPLYSAVAIPAKVTTQIAGPVAALAQRYLAGESYSAYRKAAQAGFNAPKVDREAFVSHLVGKADEAEIVNSVRSAFSKMQKERSDNFFESMKDVYKGNIPNTDYALIDKAVNDARAMVYNIGSSGVSRVKYQNAANLLNDIEAEINFYKQNYRDPAFGSLKGAHELKVTIGDKKNGYMDPLSRKIGENIYHAVRDTIAADPKIGKKYMKTMEEYGKMSDDLAEIAGAFGVGRRNLKSTSLKKILSTKDNQTKKALIDELAKRDSRIPFMIAGNELHDWLPGGFRQALLGTSALGHVGVLGPLGAAVSIPIQAGLHSPRTMASLSYAAGRLGAGAKAATSPAARAGIYGATAPQRTTEEPIGEPALRKYLDVIGMHESRGDLKAANKLSPARGKYQFMPKTWREIRDKNPDLNLPPSPMQASELQQFQAANWLTNNNSAVLERYLRRKPTYSELGLAHYFGANGAVSLLKLDPNTRFDSLPENFWGSEFTNSTLMRQNPNLRNQTIRGIKNYYDELMRKNGLASGGRVARASGGRIMSHDMEADRLIRAAEIAKKSIGKQTEAILEKPDEHVVQALAVANRHI